MARKRYRFLAGLLGVVLSMAVVAQPALGLPPRAETTMFKFGSSVHVDALAFDGDGQLWFVGAPWERRTVVGQVGADGTITEFPVPGPEGFGYDGSIAEGPDGAMWFTVPRDGAIGRVTASGEISLFSLFPSAWPTQLVTGPDGSLWFTMPRKGRVGRITTSGALTEFPFGRRSEPRDIAVGPDGNLWVTLEKASRIVRLSPTGDRTIFRLLRTEPRNIVAGTGGLWFTEGSSSRSGERGRNRLGRITTEGQVTQFRVPAMFGTGEIAAGPDGRIWFTTSPRLGAVEWISPAGELGPRVCLDDLCTLPASSLAFAPDGVLWFGTSFQVCVYCGGGTGMSLAMQPGFVGHFGL